MRPQPLFVRPSSNPDKTAKGLTMAIEFIGSRPLTQTNAPLTLGAEGASKTDGISDADKVGGGNLSNMDGPVPDVKPQSQEFKAMLTALIAFEPELGNADQEVLLAEVITKLKDTQNANDKEGIKADSARKQAAINEQKEKLDKAEKKQAEAEEKQKSASIWDKIKLAFQFLAAAISIVVGAILVATGAGTALGLLMIAGGVIGIVQGIDSALKQSTGFGMAGLAAKGRGESDEKALQDDFITGMVMTGVSIAISVATLAVSFTAAGNIASATAKVANEIKKQAAEFAASVQKMANIVSQASNLVTAVGDVGAGAVRYTASTLTADATKLRAEGKRSEASIKVLDEMIDQAISRLIASGDRFNQMLDGMMDTLQDKSRSLTQAQFTA